LHEGSRGPGIRRGPARYSGFRPNADTSVRTDATERRHCTTEDLVGLFTNSDTPRLNGDPLFPKASGVQCGSLPADARGSIAVSLRRLALAVVEDMLSNRDRAWPGETVLAREHDRRWWQPRPPRIRVVILPTDTYRVCSLGCDIHKIIKRLNRVQRCFRFVVLARASRVHGRLPRHGVTLMRRTRLQYRDIREAAAKTPDERRKAVDTYIEGCDAFEQIEAHASGLMASYGEKQLGDNTVVAIGSEVVVADNDDNAFEGDAAQDAYSLQWMSEGELRQVGDHLLPLKNVAFISLRRLAFVFGEAVLTDNPERARAIVARYIIINLANFVGNRAFDASLFHHDLTGCLNESSWVGGERDAYYVEGYCQRCEQQYRDMCVSPKHDRWHTEEVLAAVQRLLQVPDEIDRIVRSTQRIIFWVQFCTVTVATQIFAAAILDIGLRTDWWDDQTDQSKLAWLPHVKTHDIAYFVAAIFGAIGIGMLVRHARRHARLP
jgi:hypothetical protein